MTMLANATSTLAALALAAAASGCKQEPASSAGARAEQTAAPAAAPAAAPPPPPTFPEDRPAHGKAVISGVVRYQGPVPEPTPVDFTYDPACKPLMPDPFVREVEVDR